MDDLISRNAAIDAMGKAEWAKERLRELPSAQPTEASCWGCNCQKMERLKEQKTFSEMVHLHDAETHEERTETHTCDLISRQAVIEAMEDVDWYHVNSDGQLVHGANSNEDEPLYKAEDVYKVLEQLPSAQPEIIRCKDCKHHGTNGYRLNCAVFCCTMPDDGFCSCGERREDG